MKYRFKSIELDSLQRELVVDGLVKPLAPKALSLLFYLIEHRDRMVSKRELLDAFWSVSVSEAALLKSISLIRKALDEDGADEPIIKTHHGVGYRFMADVEMMSESITESPTEITLSEHRLASIICINLCNTDSGVSTNELLEFEGFLAQAQPIVDRHHGSLLHMLVDGFTVAFGLQALYEDVARQAVSCAVELSQIVSENSQQPSEYVIRAGIETGIIELIDEKNKCWNPPGDIERRASSLSQKAKQGEIILSPSTLEHLNNEVETEPANQGFKLISPPLQRAGVPGRTQKSSQKFVGRSAEFAFLNENVNRSMQGQGTAVMLSGPAGIGKTRLVSELLIKLDGSDSYNLLLNCLPSLINTPLAPIRELCRRLVDLVELPPQANPDQQQALLQYLTSDSASSNPILPGMSDYERRQKSYQLVDSLLARVCNKFPFTLAIEDVHWIDTTSQEFLNDMIRYVGNKRLMLLITTRPSESNLLVDTVLKLSPLGPGECYELLHSNQMTQGISLHLADTLIERAAGNPFFLEELAFSAQAGTAPCGEVPETVQAVVSVRVGSLPQELRNLVYIIAVIGPPAPTRLIAHLFGRREADIIALLGQLIKKGFLIQDLDSYAFRHMLINDCAYSMITSQDRMHLHGLIAQYLESGYANGEVRPEKLAWHLQEAGQITEALPLWIAASRLALKHSNYHETIAFSSRGLELLDRNNLNEKSQRLDLQLLQASTLSTLHGFGATEAGEAYRKAQTLDNEVGTAKTRVRVLVGLWIHSWVKGNLSESLSYANALMALAEQSQRPALQLQAHASLGQVLMHLARIEEALAHLHRGLESIADESPATLPEQNAATSCAAYAAWCASILGRSAEAEGYYQQSRHLASLFKNPFALAIHYALCPAYFMYEGDAENCLQIADKAVAISQQHNFSFWLATGLILRGWALGQLADFDQAFEAFDKGIQVFQTTGAGVQLSNWYGLQAETQWRAGRNAEGLESVHKALHHARLTEDEYFTPRIHSIASRIHHQLGNKGQSRTHATKASELVELWNFAPAVIQLQDL
jgi:predicted ATPase/DNA-binding winged helix-turn-helix (wHTH) protein